jgi:acetate kinase
VMGTRSGDVDPGVLFYLARKGYTPPQLDTMLNKKSGVLGISGVSNDLRDVHEAAAKGNERAKLALEIFAYRVRKYIGAYLAVLDGCDALVFTGGIGENGTAERRRILAGLDHLGIKIDNARNESAPNGEAHIHADDSRIKVLVIPTNEEAAIATDTYEIVTGGGKIPQ